MIHVPAEAERNIRNAAVQINSVLPIMTPDGTDRWGLFIIYESCS